MQMAGQTVIGNLAFNGAMLAGSAVSSTKYRHFYGFS
jgi:hypothetical protein